MTDAEKIKCRSSDNSYIITSLEGTLRLEGGSWSAEFCGRDKSF